MSQEMISMPDNIKAPEDVVPASAPEMLGGLPDELGGEQVRQEIEADRLQNEKDAARFPLQAGASVVKSKVIPHQPPQMQNPNQ